MSSAAPAMPSCEGKGRVHSLESFGSVDGPGVRYVVFMQGCTLRCKYCHNPETWAFAGGTEMTADEVLTKALRYKSYWGRDGKRGGITVSGGEPLLQLDFVTELFQKAKARGVHTALDTAGQPFCDDPAWLTRLDKLLAVTDLVILDLKEPDEERHRSLTGQGNANIFAFARYCADKGVGLWIRHVLVPGLTDDADGLRKLGAFIATLPTVQRVEVLPYHTLGLFKWQQLGMDYPLPDAAPPGKNQIALAEQLLGVENYRKS